MAVRGAPPPPRAARAELINPLLIWLLLLGSFLLLNGISFILAPASQLRAVLPARVEEPSPRWWKDGRKTASGRDYEFALAVAEHITSTLGASYLAMGLFILALAHGMHQRRAVFVVLVWSAVQLLFLKPTVLEAGAAFQRFAFHATVVGLTLGTAALSSLRQREK